MTKQIMQNADGFRKKDFGTCIVKFIVDKNGHISEVEATTMKKTRLAKVAVEAIENGPKWTPAQQNGRYVNAYRLQPVTVSEPAK
jgi:periplasmic protein TonB